MTGRDEGARTITVCADFDPALSALRADGWRVDAIWPADAPHSADLSRDDERRRLTMQPDAARPDGAVPLFQSEFHVTPASGEGAPGRAGMAYRDLIPSRLGGYAVASHIRIDEGGAVDDWVHFHRLALQFIAVRRGWVRVVYEGQGAPFVMAPGDLVLQPPTIRHRVLESSAGLEVVELSIPAVHETCTDHDLELPGARDDFASLFADQPFFFHRSADMPWQRQGGAEIQDTGLAAATSGKARASFLRATGASTVDVQPHAGELGFGFVMDGEGVLVSRGEHRITEGSSFMIPSGEAWSFEATKEGLCVLWVVTNGFSGQSA